MLGCFKTIATANLTLQLHKMKTVSVFFTVVILLKGIYLRAAENNSKCPEKINLISSSNVQPTCSKGKFFINNKEVAKVKSTDRVEIISNNLIINGKFIRHFPPFGNSRNLSQNGNWSGGHLTSRAANCKCPTVIQIGCINVTDSCTRNKFYINGIRIKNVKSTDKVVIVSNNLYINDKFIQYIPPFGVNEPRARQTEKDDDSDIEEDEENEDGDISKKKKKKKKKIKTEKKMKKKQ